jgi:ABC-2 type transport system permease protein
VNLLSPGSTLWLLGWEMRLAFRGIYGTRRLRARLIGFGIIGVGCLAMGVPLALFMQRQELPLNPYTILGADMAALFVFTLMLSQTLAGATEALYTRGDLDLVFSAPIEPRRVLTVRFASLSATAFSSFALLATPLLAPSIILGHWRWLAFYPTLAALAMASSGMALALAVALFRLIGPRRTRTVAQLLAAVIGAAFFLTTQARTLLGGAGSASLWAQIGDLARDPRLKLPDAASWPLRAATGDPAPLAFLLFGGFAIFLAIAGWLADRFVADAAAAQGADVGVAKTPGRTTARFVGGAFAATFVKELRLLWRDIALTAQVLLRTLYLIPATFLVIRAAGSHAAFALPSGAAMIAFLAGQVGGSLTWITLSAEDAPELLASAPAQFRTLRWAKLAAAFTPLAVLMVIPMGIFIYLAPVAGLAALAGAAASALSAGLINAWHPVRARRSEFRRRRQGSLLVSLALMLETALVGGATMFAALASPFALIPAAAALVILALMRRSPARIAESLAAA